MFLKHYLMKNDTTFYFAIEKTNTITYKLSIYGDYKSIEKQLSDSSFFEIVNSSFNDDYLHLAYKK